MKWLYCIAAIAAVFDTLPAAAAEEAGSKDFAARMELHQIATLTLSDRQFLEGDAGGKPVTITGELRIAQGSGRLPVVVLEHGSGGISANLEFWARELNKQGISTFALDNFTGRGLTEVATNQALLGRLNFILDIYRSLELLAKHPRVDPARIALMGFSRGGQAALYASLSRFQRLWNKSGVDVVAYIPLYPDCSTTYLSDTEVASRPIRVFGGTPDDFNPIAPCKAYVDRLKSAGRDVALTEYPNAPHVFDNPLGAQPAALSPRAQSVRHCTIREETIGTLINVDTRQPFSYEDACVERGAHLGADPAAAEATKTAVTAVLRATFKLD